MSTPRWSRWRVTPQGRPAQEIEIVHPLTVEESRQQWQPGPGNPGLFNGRRVASARPIGPPVQETEHTEDADYWANREDLAQDDADPHIQATEEPIA